MIKGKFRKSRAFNIYISLFIVLVLGVYSSNVIGAPHVLVITPPESDQTSNKQLQEISLDGRKKLADVSHNILFGTDNTKLALLDSLDAPANGCRLLVIDRETSAIIVNTNITGFTPVRRMQPVEDLVDVQSDDSSVYFPITDDRDRFEGIAKVDWNINKSQMVSAKAIKDVGEFFYFASFPSGFALMGFNMKIGIFNIKTLDRVLMLQDNLENGPSEDRRLYYVPGFGLMQYCRGMHYRLTDADISTIFVNSKRIPSSKVDSRIFVRTIDDKPCLIWGTQESGLSPRRGTISELVIFDLTSGTELLHKPLGTSASAAFCPDITGSKIYFLDLKNGKIDSLDTRSNTITPFCDLGTYDPARVTILDAY